MSAPQTPWLTVEQAAERLQVSVRTVERMVSAGVLRERRYERTRRYHVTDVDAALMPTDEDDSTT
jgi:excisionase family DNA binding protein